MSQRKRETGTSSQPSQPRAGQAFLREVQESAPEDRRQVLRPLQELYWFSRAIQVVGKDVDLSTLRSPMIEELRPDVDLSCSAGGDEVSKRLSAAGFTPPQTFEDWLHLARVVELDPDPLTLREIYQQALAWSDREKIRVKLAQQVASTVLVPQTPVSREDVIPDAEPDRLEPGCARYFGRRIYLGVDTQISRLFWLLCTPIGRACTLQEVQRAVDGMETRAELGNSEREVKQASQRLRKAFERLRKRFRESGLDHHLLVLSAGTKICPEYTLIQRFTH